MARTTKVSAAQARNSVGATDWNKLKNLSDAEIEALAASDSATKRFAPQELREFKRGGLKPSAKSGK
jgi:hypothetical protein